MNYYLDESINITGSLVINGKIINIKSEKIFNTYNDLIKLTSLVNLNKEIIDVNINGNLIIREYTNYDLNVLGNNTVMEIITLE
jgi:hypothetical protein